MNGFTLYKEYYELITLLPEKDQQELLLAIAKYMFEDVEPKLNDKQTKIFNNLAHKEKKCVIIVTHSPNVCNSVDTVYDLKKSKK